VSSAPDDILTSSEAGGLVIRGSVWRLAANGAGIALGLVTATLLLRHLGVSESGRYVTVLSLVAIAVSVASYGLNVSGSRDLALREPGERRALLANIVGQRMIVMPLAVVAMVLFALAAQYPARMVTGTLLAGIGATIAAVADALLLPLTVELRNVGLALVDFMRQAVTLALVAILVAADARLEPFFAVLIVAGLAMLAMVPVVAGKGALIRPSFDRATQHLLLVTAFPLAVAFGLGQVYSRLVIVLM